MTGGMTWNGDYNMVAPETGDTLDLVGWVTLDNQSGKQFDHAHIKLMAGDVNKVQAQGFGLTGRDAALWAMVYGGRRRHRLPRSRSKTTICTACRSPPRCTTAKPSRWSSCAGCGIPSKRLYIYDGVAVDRNSTATRTCARSRNTAPNPIRTCG